MLKHLGSQYNLFLLSSDVLIVILALQLATFARINIVLGMQVSQDVWKLPFPVYIIAILIWTLAFNSLEVYSPTQIKTLAQELQHLTLVSLVAWLLMTGLLYLTYRDVSRLEMIYFLVFCLGLLWLHRILVRFLLVRLHWLNFRLRYVLIIGVGKVAQELAETIREYHWAGLHLVGFVTL